MAQKKLQAVGYCRTSSESQRDNTSIDTQKEQIKAHVDRNGWSFVSFYVDECKSGKTVAGRDEYIRMLRDAANKQFDVVVAWNIKRFGRDGVDILTDSRMLKRNFDIGVVDTLGAYDSRDPRRTLSNYVHAGAAEEERISILERTSLGKLRSLRENNGPGSSKRPVGRLWDKKTKTWSIDQKVQKMYEDVARRYLRGESLAKLAEKYGVNHSTLHKNLTRRCGDIWEQRVRRKELGINETIQTKVPRLLPQKTIDAVLAKVAANKTYQHGHIVHRYLLSRMVFCGHCGYTMSGQTNHGNRRYYRHAYAKRLHQCEHANIWCRADDLEGIVMRHLFEMFGNAPKFQRAIADANPQLEERDELLVEKDRVDHAIEKNQSKMDRLVNKITDDLISDTEAATTRDRLRADRKQLDDQLREINQRLASMFSPDEMRKLEEKVTGMFAKASRRKISAKSYAAERYNNSLAEMSWEDQRELVERIFTGKMADGRRMGVYVTAAEGQETKRQKCWNYSIHGFLIDLEDYRFDESHLEDGAFNFGSAPKQKRLVKQNLLGERDTHYRVRFH